MENELKKLTTKLQLSDKISFQKNLPRSKLIKTLSRSHLFCLPSTVEGFGLVTIEAMAAGLPTVLSNIPINQEITKKGQGALFFKPNQPGDLAKKITKLKNNPNLYQTKKLEAQKLVNHYSWKKIYQQTKKVYETCYST